MSAPAFHSINMSASWEGEKQSSHVVTRYCNFKVVQIILDNTFENDSPLNTIFVAVRMRNSPRKLLRTSEINFTPSKSQKKSESYITLDLNCNIIYSHSLKRDCNILQILIQRKKRYKNKTVLGYKSLAYCNIDLNQVLQRYFDNRFLDLYTNPKRLDRVVGRVEIQHLSSIPYDKLLNVNKKRKSSNILAESSFDDIDENHEAVSEESESDDDHLSEANSRNKNNLMNAVASRQRQFKQKLLGWMKKVKSMDANGDFATVVSRNELLEKFDQLTISECDEYQIMNDSFSDEENEIDLDFFNPPEMTRKQLKKILYFEASKDTNSPTNSTVSFESTPKPILRPYLGSKANAYLQNIAYSSDDTLSADAGAKLLKRLQRENLSKMPLGDASNHPVNDVQLISNDLINDRSPQLIKSEDNFSSLLPSGINDTSIGLFGKIKRSATGQTLKSNVHFEKKSTGQYLEHNTSDSNSDGKESDSQKLTKSYNMKLKGIVQSNKKYSSFRQEIKNKNPTSLNHRNRFSIQNQSFKDEVNIYPSISMTKNYSLPKLTSELNKETVDHVTEFIDRADSMPDDIFIISNIEDSGQKLLSIAKLKSANENHKLPYFPLSSIADAKYIIGHLVSRLQLMKLRSSQQPIKICLLGNDLILHAVLRAFVDSLSGIPSEFSSILRFYLVPITFLNPNAENFDTKVNDELHLKVLDEILNKSVNDETHDQTLNPNAFYWSLTRDKDKINYDQNDPNDKVFQYIHNTSAEINTMACHLCRVDRVYSLLFSEYLISEEYRQSFPKTSLSNLTLLDRVMLYVTHSTHILNLSIGECLIGIGDKTVNYSGSSANMNSGQGNFSNAFSSTTPLSTSFSHHDLGKDLKTPITDSHVCVEKEPASRSDDLLIPFLIHVSLGCDPVSALLSTHLDKNPNKDSSVIGQGLPNSSISCVTTQTCHNSTSIQGLPIIDSTLNSQNNRTENLRTLLFDLQLECLVTQVNNATQSPLSSINKSSHEKNCSNSQQNNVKRIVNKCCSRGLKVVSGSLISHLKCPPFYDGMIPDLSPVHIHHPLFPGISKFSESFQNTILVLAMANKEKKQKISLLNKKSKDAFEYRHEFMSNVNRIICSGRRHQAITQGSINQKTLPVFSHSNDDNSDALNKVVTYGNHLTINIDGVEWNNVKFFQVVPTWRTHVKNFPLATFTQGINSPVELAQKVKAVSNEKRIYQNLNFINSNNESNVLKQPNK